MFAVNALTSYFTGTTTPPPSPTPEDSKGQETSGKKSLSTKQFNKAEKEYVSTTTEHVSDSMLLYQKTALQDVFREMGAFSAQETPAFKESRRQINILTTEVQEANVNLGVIAKSNPELVGVNAEELRQTDLQYRDKYFKAEVTVQKVNIFVALLLHRMNSLRLPEMQAGTSSKDKSDFLHECSFVHGHSEALYQKANKDIFRAADTLRQTLEKALDNLKDEVSKFHAAAEHGGKPQSTPKTSFPRLTPAEVESLKKLQEDQVKPTGGSTNSSSSSSSSSSATSSTSASSPIIESTSGSSTSQESSGSSTSQSSDSAPSTPTYSDKVKEAGKGEKGNKTQGKHQNNPKNTKTNQNSKK